MNNSLLKIYAKYAWIIIFKNVKTYIKTEIFRSWWRSSSWVPMILLASLSSTECVPMLTLLQNLLNHSNQINLQLTGFLSERAWMARYQFQFYDLDEFYMIFVRYWKWKIDGCTSGFCFGKFWLTLCMFGVWRWFLSLGCFGDVWVIQTTFIWYLESVRSITLVRNCKVWKLSF